MPNPRDPNLPPLPPTQEKKVRKKLERMLEAREAREEGTQELGIGLRPLIMCGLPLRPLKGHYYKRRCGDYTVEVFGHPDYGVPYGQDRLLPIFFATYFVHLGCPEDNTIVFPSARSILRIFGLPLGGSYYQRLQASFRRLSKAFFSIESNLKQGKGRWKCTENIPLMAASRLWYEEGGEEGEEKAPVRPPSKLTNLNEYQERIAARAWKGEMEEAFERSFGFATEKSYNVIRLDERWAQEIREHPVPVDLQTVRGLRDHPGALDFYQWQIWRSYSVKKETRVPLGGPNGLLAQLGCLAGQPTFELRRKLRDWQGLIKLQWPGCPNIFSRDGQAFVLRPAKALGQLEANRFLLKLLASAESPKRSKR
jgi:hypothetical protein